MNETLLGNEQISTKILQRGDREDGFAGNGVRRESETKREGEREKQEGIESIQQN